MSLSLSEILLSLVDNHSIYTPCHMSLSLSEILHVRCKTLIQYQICLTVQPAHLYPRVLPPSYFFPCPAQPARLSISYPGRLRPGRDESTDGPTGHLHAARFCELLAPRPRNRSPDDTPNAEFISARPHGTTKPCLIYYEEANARRPAPSHDRMSCELAMCGLQRAGVVWYWRLQMPSYVSTSSQRLQLL